MTTDRCTLKYWYQSCTYSVLLSRNNSFSPSLLTWIFNMEKETVGEISDKRMKFLVSKIFEMSRWLDERMSSFENL